MLQRRSVLRSLGVLVLSSGAPHWLTGCGGNRDESIPTTESRPDAAFGRPNPDGTGPGILPPFETPVEDFYCFNNATPPDDITAAAATLDHGYFDPREPLASPSEQPRQRDVRSLREALPKIESYRTLCCVGNGKPFDTTFGWRFGGISNGRWEMSAVDHVLSLLGLEPRNENDVLRVSGRDGWIRNFSQSSVSSGRLFLAFGMNGRPLPHKHGGPMRLVASGDYGEMNVKWVNTLTWGPAIQTAEDQAAELPAHPMAFATTPRWGAQTRRGTLELAGLAYAGRHGVARATVQLDGRDMPDAELLDPPRAGVWSRWRTSLELGTGQHVVSIGCEDERGKTSLRLPIENAWADLDHERANHELILQTNRA